MMTRKCKRNAFKKKQKKGSWSKRVHIKKQKNCKRKPKKCKQNAKQQLKRRKTKANKTHKKCTCTTKFHTPPFLCDVFSMFVRFMCDSFLQVLRFLRVFFAFSQGNAQKMQTKRKYKAKNCKGKDQNGFDRMCFAF